MRTIDDVLAYLAGKISNACLRSEIASRMNQKIKALAHEVEARAIQECHTEIQREYAIASLGCRKADSDTEVAGDVCGCPGEQVASGGEGGLVPVGACAPEGRSDDTDGYADDKHFRTYWRRQGHCVPGHGNSPRADAVLPYSP